MIGQQEIGVDAGEFTGSLGSSEQFGSSVASLGDLDGDGVVDLAVGSRRSQSERGAVWILFLNADGTVKAHQKIGHTDGGFEGVLQGGDWFGNAVAALGDVDLDGVTDIAVGAPHDSDGGNSKGAVWVLFLNADGTVKSHQKISAVEGGFTGVLANNDNFGWSVASLGDQDGDGCTDMAVGASQDDDGGTRRGAVWVTFLQPDGTVKAHQKISNTAGGFEGVLDDDDRFGSAVAGLGDLNGDGFHDMAVGAPNDDDGGGAGFGSNTGAMWILFLGADASVKGYQKVSPLHGGFTGALSVLDTFGEAATDLGDLDGDGVADIAVGASGDDDGHANGTPFLDRGAVWVLFLNSDGTVKSHQKISDTQGGFTGDLVNGDYFGHSVTLVGDVNGDGINDLAAGAIGDDNGAVGDTGAAWVLLITAAVWADLGHALAGTNGAPLATGSGTLVGGDLVQLDLANALQTARVALVIGLGALNAPLAGGTLVPDPTLPGGVFLLLTDSAGSVATTGAWPSGVPSGFSLYFQYWVVDQGAPFGYAASNAVKGTTP